MPKPRYVYGLRTVAPAWGKLPSASGTYGTQEADTGGPGTLLWLLNLALGRSSLLAMSLIARKGAPKVCATCNHM